MPTTLRITILEVFGLISLLTSLPFLFVGGFENLFFTGIGLTLFCLSNAFFRLALKEEYLLSDSVVSALATIHDKEINEYIEKRQKEIKEKKKK